MIAIMWTTFWLDALIAIIGATLTVAIAYVTYILNLRLNERRALISLISELYHRRAFSGRATVVHNARELADFSRANASVLSIKDEIRHARDVVRELPQLQGPLSGMTKACNGYLEKVEHEPDSYAFELIVLRDKLHHEIVKIAQEARGVPAYEPGGGAVA